MRAFYIIVHPREPAAPRRIDFHAESPDHAFQVARNESDGVMVELWEEGRLLAHMTKSGANIWKLHGAPEDKARPVGEKLPA